MITLPRQKNLATERCSWTINKDGVCEYMTKEGA